MVTTTSLERVRELQQRVRRMENVGISSPVDLLPALADVMTLRTGTVCSVDSPGLALAMAAGAARAGAWIGFAGLPEVGWEAAADLGIDLERTVAVPFPGEHWLSVTAALVDVIGVVVARPPGQVREAEAGRLAARLRQRGATLIVDGAWPRAALRLTTVTNNWQGLGSGHGHLRGRQVQVEISTPAGVPRLVTVELPAADGTVTSRVDRPAATEIFEPASAMVG